MKVTLPLDNERVKMTPLPEERKERLLAGKRHDTGTVGDAGWQCRTVGAEDKLGP